MKTRDSNLTLLFVTLSKEAQKFLKKDREN